MTGSHPNSQIIHKTKMIAILRTKSYYSPAQLISQFKTHIWGIVECNIGGIFHAADHILNKLDALQNRFLRELDMDAATTFLEYNFAPLALRRDIGILGLLQKRVLGLIHPIFQRLLPFHIDAIGVLRTGEHTRQ